MRDNESPSQIINDNPSAYSRQNHNLSHLIKVVTRSNRPTKLLLDYFDEEGYVKRGGLQIGEDPYVRNRFNQQASDSIPSNREIPDTRNSM